MPLAERRERGRRLLNRVGLAGFEEHYPGELSGGMTRRTAPARTLGKEAGLLLMDEPFLSLDGELRSQLVDLTGRILQDDRRTTLCVTHDVSVAERLANRVITLAHANSHTVLDSDRRVRS